MVVFGGKPVLVEKNIRVEIGNKGRPEEFSHSGRNASGKKENELEIEMLFLLSTRSVNTTYHKELTMK
jgi:hypothetical protein